MNKILSKLIKLVKLHQDNLVLGLTVTLLSFLSFQAGKIYTFSHWQPLTNFYPGTALTEDIFITDTLPTSTSLSIPIDKTNPTKIFEMTVIASKNSNKYHFLWCPGGSKISAKNKIIFSNETAAIVAGYTLASNCQK